MISKSLLSFTSAPMVHLEVEVHTRVFFLKKNTAAVMCSANNQHFRSYQSGKDSQNGILEAEFLGFIHALEYLNTL